MSHPSFGMMLSDRRKRIGKSFTVGEILTRICLISMKNLCLIAGACLKYIETITGRDMQGLYHGEIYKWVAILCSTGSQCRCFRAGVLWSNLRRKANIYDVDDIAWFSGALLLTIMNDTLHLKSSILRKHQYLTWIIDCIRPSVSIMWCEINIKSWAMLTGKKITVIAIRFSPSEESRCQNIFRNDVLRKIRPSGTLFPIFSTIITTKTCMTWF